jgi:tetratricopeptide (TPR) repeat protein
LVFSSLGRIGDRFILTLQAERIGAAPDPPAQTWNTSIPISGPEQMFEGVRQAAHWIRATAGESELELSGHDRLPQNITSASWEALQLYQEAQELNQSGKPAESIPFYRRAIAEDSSFAMALMRLGDTLVSQRDSKEGFNFWRQAIDAGRAQRLDERERLNLESRYALETADYPKAEPILREWVRKYPNDPRPSEWLVATLRGLGRDEDAVAEAKKRTERFGPSLFSIGHLIHALGTTGRLDEIPAYFQVLEQLNAKGVALRFRGILAAVRGNHPEAEQYFHSYESVAKGAEASQARALLATLAAEHGDYPRAIDLLRNGMDLDRQGGMIGLAAAKASGIAYLKLLQNNRAESEEWAHEALALQSSPQIVMQVVTILARNGKTEAAARVLKQMPAGEGPGHNARVARARGELSLARGDIEGGLSLLELAAATEGATRPKGYLARALELAHQQTRANDALYVRQSPWISWTWPEVEWPAGNHNTRQ